MLSYSLVDDAQGRFAIDASTGVITVLDGSGLDYEVATAHAITVRVTDQDGLTRDQAFAVSLTNVNEAPTAVALTGGTVAENAVAGTVVGTAAGSDPDPGQC